MQDRETLVQICREIAAEGMTPGVGLLRARSPFKISVAQAIEVLKSYKHDKPVPLKSQPSAARTDQQALEDRILALETRMQQLEMLLQEALKGRSG